MAATLTPEVTPDGGGGVATQLAPLPWTLDVSCPLAMPSRRASGAAQAWPFPVAGPSTAPDETLDAFVTRRYFEALYLGETLFPLAGLVRDLDRARVAHADDLGGVLARLVLPLAAVEMRHRRTLAPVLAALLGSGTSTASRTALDEAVARADLADAERDALAAAVALRASSRAVTEGTRALVARTLAQELEQREVLIQIVLLLVYRTLPTPADQPETQAAPPPAKKRRRGKEPQPKPPTTDPPAALELLSDRVSVWLAIGELGITGDLAPVSAGAKGKGREDEGVAGVVQRFWETVLVPHFLPREAAFLTAFHAKVFGRPIAPELVPAKKRRKPQVTRRLSLDTKVPSAGGGMRRSSSRMSQASEDASGVTGPSLRRPLRAEDRTSRSSSVDPLAREPPARSTIVRAPSGKDLFKGREVLRRTVSIARNTGGGNGGGNGSGGSGAAGRDESQAQSQSQMLGRSVGLMGRSLARSASASAAAARASAAAAETLIFATPAKQRGHAHAAGGGRRAMAHPTPIREEPSSGARSRSYVAETPGPVHTVYGAYVAETPVAPSRQTTSSYASGSGAAGVAQTPFRPRPALIAETPLHGPTSDDDLADLMVPTDDESASGEDSDDERRPALGQPFALETPRK